MGIRLPVNDNPYSVAITPNDTRARMGLVAAPETKYGTAKMVGAATSMLAKEMDAWGKQIDQTNAQDAINKTKFELDDLENNPETGWANQKGEKALNRDSGKSLMEEVGDSQNEIYNRHLSALKTPRARAMYQQYIDAQRMDTSSRVQKHVFNQQKAYGEAVDQATMASAVNDYSSLDPAKMRSAMDVIKGLIQKKVDSTGMPVSVYDTLGKIHEATVGRFLDRGRADLAAGYLRANKDEMSNVQYESAQKQVTAVETENKADAAAETLAETYSLNRSGFMKELKKNYTPEMQKKIGAKVAQIWKYNDAVVAQENKEDFNKAVDTWMETGKVPPQAVQRMKDKKQWDYVAKLEKMSTVDEVKESDLDALQELTELKTNDPGAFVEKDIAHEYADRLTRNDIKRFSVAQSTANTVSSRLFESELQKRINSDSKLRQHVLAIKEAAGPLYKDLIKRSANKSLTKDQIGHALDLLLSRETRFWGDRGYEVISKAKENRVAPAEALANANLEADWATSKNVVEILRQNKLTLGAARDGLEQANKYQAAAARVWAEFGPPAGLQRRATKALAATGNTNPSQDQVQRFMWRLLVRDQQQDKPLAK